MTSEQRACIIRLRNQGMGYTAIAKAAGVPKDTVKFYCRRNSLGRQLAQPTYETGSKRCPHWGKKITIEEILREAEEDI